MIRKEEIYRILTELGFEMKVRLKTFQKKNITIIINLNSDTFSISLYKELEENRNIDVRFMDILEEDFEEKIKFYLNQLTNLKFY